MGTDNHFRITVVALAALTIALTTIAVFIK
jgi:hypothetical protein